MEDDSILVDLLTRTFSNHPPFELRTTDKLKEAIRIAAAMQPNLTIADLGLTDSDPDHTAKFGIRALSDVNPNGATMVFTGLASEDRIKMAKDNGADAVLEKGAAFNKATLARGMSDALEHKGGACKGFICLIEGLLGVKL